MDDVRCACNKLLAKVDGDKVIIKCRHCKRFIVIQGRQIKKIEYRESPYGSSETRVQRL